MVSRFQGDDAAHVDKAGVSKGSRNNHSPEFAPRFASGLVDLREHNRRRRKGDVEDCASEDWPNLARRWDAKMGSYYFASPKKIMDRWQMNFVGFCVAIR